MKYISFAIPCYNSQDYMAHAIESILPGGEDVEIIIVNDGSKDRTSEIAHEYKEKYPTIVKVVDKENGGHGDAVNSGLTHATGKYFKVVDGDDWVDQDGFVHLKGRMKRIYMTQGEDGTLYKVFPARTEMVLMELGNVKKCAVTVRMEGKLVKEQIAYLVLDKKAEKENVLEMVRAHCRKMLPSHSVPGKYILLDEIPLTQSGKTDYRALEKMKKD